MVGTIDGNTAGAALGGNDVWDFTIPTCKMNKKVSNTDIPVTGT